MIPFNLYYERFNILNLFPKLKKRLFDKTVRDRQEVRAHARENIMKLKDVLKKDGYTIQKSDDSYTVRRTREMKLNSPRGESNFRTSVSIPYLKVWFTLAHEVGHVLQFQDGKPEIARRIDEYSSLVKDFNTRKTTVPSIRQLEPELWSELEELYNFWSELDAWIRGLQFIPVQYQPMYKRYAKAMYNTYKSSIVKQQMFRYTDLLSQLQ
jgi:hypothetical protein